LADKNNISMAIKKIEELAQKRLKFDETQTLIDLIIEKDKLPLDLLKYVKTAAYNKCCFIF
jgi:hypothetical protein